MCTSTLLPKAPAPALQTHPDIVQNTAHLFLACRCRHCQQFMWGDMHDVWQQTPSMVIAIPALGVRCIVQVAAYM